MTNNILDKSTRSGLKAIFHGANSLPYVEIPSALSPKDDRKYAGSGLKFGENPNDKTYEKIHLAISRGTYDEVKNGSRYATTKEGFSVRPVMNTDAKTLARLFLDRLQKVEPSLGWPNRTKYQKDNFDSLVEEISEDMDDSMILDFYDGDTHVGFTKISGIAVDWSPRDHEKGLDKFVAVNLFAKQEGMKKAPNPVEVDKFAMFPESMGRGFGKVALASALEYLFEQRGHNIVYLDTRTTNPVGTEDFYQKMGLRSFAYEQLKNDLAEPVEWPPKHGLSSIKDVAMYYNQTALAAKDDTQASDKPNSKPPSIEPTGP